MSRLSAGLVEPENCLNWAGDSACEGIGGQCSRRCQSWRARARGTQGVVLGIVPALRDSRPAPCRPFGRIPGKCCLTENIALCAAVEGGGARRHAGFFRPLGKGARAISSRGTSALAFGLHTSIPGQQWPHGPFPDERDAGVRRLAVSGDRDMKVSSRRHCGSCPLLSNSCPLARTNPYSQGTAEQRLRFAVWLQEAE